jgi:hypothetical protein
LHEPSSRKVPKAERFVQNYAPAASHQNNGARNFSVLHSVSNNRHGSVQSADINAYFCGLPVLELLRPCCRLARDCTTDNRNHNENRQTDTHHGWQYRMENGFRFGL